MASQLDALLTRLGERAAEKMETPVMSLQLAIGRVIAQTVDSIADAAEGLAQDGWTLEMFVAMLRGDEDADTKASDESEPSDG